MKQRLLKYLVCPSCKEALRCNVYQEDHTLPWPEIREGLLMCEPCGRDYQIRKGVPRMLIGEQPAEVHDTVNSFGWQWLTFDEKIQDTYMTGKDHFLDFIHPVTEDFFKEKMVLDAGCGMGRFLNWGAAFGSRAIIGVDLSESVEAAYRHTREVPNAHVVQADIMALPFEEQFDYIYSVGVLHHLVDPKAGFSRLADLLRHHGKISAWVYSREHNGWVIHLLSPLRKYVTSRLPKPVLLFLSHLLGLPLYALLQGIYKPINELRPALGRFLPYNAYLYYSSRLPYTALVSVVFDHLVPQLAAYISRGRFESWFRDEKLADVTITSRNNMSWRGLGTRVSHIEETV